MSPHADAIRVCIGIPFHRSDRIEYVYCVIRSAVGASRFAHNDVNRRRGLESGDLALSFGGAMALAASWLAPYDPGFINLQEMLVPPSPAHPLGTDVLGRDVLSRIIFGSRVSLLVGFVAVGIATLIGLLVGSLAGYYGGWVDQALMRLVDLMLCFPTLFLILAVIAMLEPSIWNIMVVIGLTSWMGVARLVRAELLSLREQEFVLAARSQGAHGRGDFAGREGAQPLRREGYGALRLQPAHFRRGLADKAVNRADASVHPTAVNARAQTATGSARHMASRTSSCSPGAAAR